jgi:hypothetical protein
VRENFRDVEQNPVSACKSTSRIGKANKVRTSNSKGIGAGEEEDNKMQTERQEARGRRGEI